MKRFLIGMASLLAASAASQSYAGRTSVLLCPQEGQHLNSITELQLELPKECFDQIVADENYQGDKMHISWMWTLMNKVDPNCKTIDGGDMMYAMSGSVKHFVYLAKIIDGKPEYINCASRVDRTGNEPDGNRILGFSEREVRWLYDTPLEEEAEYELTLCTLPGIGGDGYGTMGIHNWFTEKNLSFRFFGPASKYADVTVSINGLGATTHRQLKGETPALSLAPAEGWKIESLKHDGTDVTDRIAEGGIYTLPQIEADTRLDINYAYDGDIQFIDLSTGVGEITIDDSSYIVSDAAGEVKISNLNGSETVEVFSVSGQKLASHQALDNTLRISLPAGIYIIRIGKAAIKVKVG